MSKMDKMNKLEFGMGCWCGVLVLAVFCYIIILIVCLTNTDCLSYRHFVGGAGEMTYCLINATDDDMNFHFSKSSENKVRTDSVTYMLKPPFKFYRKLREMKTTTFNDETFSRAHYLFKGDSIQGKVSCPDGCTIRVYYRYSLCQRGYPHDYILEKRKKKSSSNRCAYHKVDLYNKEISGKNHEFSAYASIEAPYYVSVTKGLFSDPTGSISYNVSQTFIDTSKYVSKCNTYECLFEDIAGEEHLFVTQFSDEMVGEYEMRASYRRDKKYSLNLVAGFGYAVLAIFGLLILMFVVDLIYRFVKHDKHSSESVSLGNTSSSTKDTQENTPEPPPAETTPGEDTSAATVA